MSSNISIRSERKGDEAIIREVNFLAFDNDGYPCLVDSLRASPGYDKELSLVAIDTDRIVGHILFNRMVIQTIKGDIPALYLGPIAVRPEYQRKGIGSALMRAGLEKCRKLNHKIVLLCGHPEYYPRFGFVPAREKGLEAPSWIPDEAFMVLELVPGALSGVRGTAIIPYEFPEAE